MAFAPSSTYFDRGGDDSIVGCFFEKDGGNLFEFSRNRDAGWGEEYPHKVWVTTPRVGIDHGFRFARVLKTVAYIVVAEDENGHPVEEKWSIKDCRNYLRPEEVA